MRIGFEAKRLFNNFTGLGNYSRFVVKALADNYPQHHYTLYSPKVKSHPDTKEFRTDPKLLVRTPPKWVKGSGFGSFWRSINLGNVAFREGADILHGLSNELPVTKPKGLKTVVTVHDLIFIRYPELYSRLDVAIYKKKVIHACSTADKIIAISKQTAHDLQTYLNVSSERIKVIYQGCNSIFKATVMASQKKEIKEKYLLPDRFILSVGTLEPRKNALLVLQALTRVSSSVSLVLVGKATSYQATLDKFIESNSLAARVHFISKVNFLELPAIYQMADVFVYPSRFEGFGIPIVEAIHSGVPVIGAAGSCLAEAGGPAGVYVDPDDDESLAKEINKFLEDEPHRRQKTEVATAYVQQFEPQEIARNMIELYQGLLD